MGTLWQDLRYGARQLRRNPSFTTVAVLTLALGIGANTAIFSVVNAVLLRPLPYKDPDRLVAVRQTYPKKGRDSVFVSPPNFADWREQNQVFEDMAAQSRKTFNLTGDGEPERIQGTRVSAGFFPLYRVRVALGRTFLPEEDKPGGEKVVILSHGLWERRFGSDPKLIGKTLTLNGESFTVVGIMPPYTNKYIREDLAVPLALTPDELSDSERKSRYLWVMARLKPDITVQEAQAEMDVIARRLEEEYPEANTGWGANVIPMHKHLTGWLKPTFLVLQICVGFVLLIACANVAGLLLARATTRQKEIAIRAAVGAGRRRLIRQLLTESVLMVALGSAVGILGALWAIKILVSGLLSAFQYLPGIEKTGMDGMVLGFTLAISLLTAVLFGLVPALQASKTELTESLKEGGRQSSADFRGLRTRNLTVVAQVALALVLLTGAGLVIKGFSNLLRVDPGFDPKNLLTMQITLPESQYPNTRQRVTFYDRLLQRLESLPGVQSTAVADALPLTWSVGSRFVILQDMPAPAPEEEVLAAYQLISPNYFHVMRVSLRKGRYFTERDGEGAAPVAIIDETLARRFWPDENPVGKHLTILGSFISRADVQPQPKSRRIVGVVTDVKAFILQKQFPHVYVPYSQDRTSEMAVAVRTDTDPTSLIPAVRHGILAVDKNQPVYNIRAMEEVISRGVQMPRFMMQLFTIFALLALVLAVVGVYGVVSYWVTQRTHDIGIRMALGAQRSDVLKVVMKHGMVLVMAGLVIGLPGAFILVPRVLSSSFLFGTNMYETLLYGVSTGDPVTFVGVSVLLTGVALVACYIPARRATKVDPMVALRYE